MTGAKLQIIKWGRKQQQVKAETHSVHGEIDAQGVVQLIQKLHKTIPLLEGGEAAQRHEERGTGLSGMSNICLSTRNLLHFEFRNSSVYWHCVQNMQIFIVTEIQTCTEMNKMK